MVPLFFLIPPWFEVGFDVANNVSITVSNNETTVTVSTTEINITADPQGPPTSGSGLNLRDYSIQGQILSWTGGAESINVDNGNSFQATLTGNVTGLTVTGWPASGVEGKATLYLIQGAGGPHMMSGWPAGVKWAGGIPPTLSTVEGDTDIVVLTTIDSGTTIYAFHLGVAA